MDELEYLAHMKQITDARAALAFSMHLHSSGVEEACKYLKKEYRDYILEAVPMSVEERTYVMMVEL